MIELSDWSLDILFPDAARRLFIEAQREPDAIGTHLPSLNEVCRDMGGGIGFAMGWHVVIGGDTGHGKSLLALNFCKDAVFSGERVGFVNLEMSPRQLQTRFYAMLTGASVHKLEPGASFSLEEANWVQRWLEEQYDKNGRNPFYVTKKPYADLNDIVAMMDEWRSVGCRVFVIDYLQLCTTTEEESMSRELAAISSRIRMYAHEHNVLTLALSQYSYGASKNVTQSPGVHSLFGSARIGQDSDMCLLLDHSRMLRDPKEKKAKTWLIVAKNRHGGYGTIPIEWDYRTLTSREGHPDEEPRWPQHGGVR